MASDAWQRLQRAFWQALDIPTEDRTEFLASAYREEPALREELRSLLTADARAEAFLEDPGVHAWARWNRSDEAVDGRRIGPYRIVEPIGRGGMGTVVLALRDDATFSKQVAIKVVSRIATPMELERFHRERQILARLEHPNIARLLDGGTTATGLPYFVMEYIEGLPIDRYCRDKRLGLRARLRLFRQVCQAVEYAHGSLVVHRDIKPSNILVTDHGGVKLLDFGIAKLLDPPREGRRSATTVGLRPMTIGYASPEQLLGLAVTTASDIYSLGVVLYELLTGRLPFERDRLTEGGRPPEGEEPPLASTVVRPEAWLEASGQTRSGLGLRRIRRRLAPDLDMVARKALRRSPRGRYASVGQLDEDVRRFLAGLPVEACRNVWTYRAARFVRRHRIGVGLAVGMVLLILGFVAATVYQRDRAQDARDRAEQVSDFLVELLRGFDPARAPGDTVTVREVLDLGAAAIPLRLADQPEVRARLLDTLGSLYRHRGVLDRSGELLREALAIRRQVFGPLHPEVAATLVHLGLVAFDQGDYPAAARLHRQALGIRRKSFGSSHPLVAETLNALGEAVYMSGDFPAALRLHTQALAARRQTLTSTDPAIAESLGNVALLKVELGDLTTPVTLYEEALAIQRTAQGGEHPRVARILNQLGNLYRFRGELEGAEPLLRESLRIRRKVYGQRHPVVSEGINDLAVMLRHKGAYGEAEALSREALEVARQVLGQEHRYVATGLYNLAGVLHGKGELEAAAGLLRESLEMVRRVLPAGHYGAAFPLSRLALVRLDQGQPRVAEALLREALELRRRSLPPGHPLTARCAGYLGRCLTVLGRLQEAETHLRASLAVLSRKRGGEHIETLEVAAWLADLRRLQGPRAAQSGSQR